MHSETIHSKFLDRDVLIDVVVPRSYQANHLECRLLVLNDGQDSAAYQLKEVMADWEQSNPQAPIIALAVHVGERRQEYGVTNRPDYALRGAKATQYGQFIEQELIPWARANFRLSQKPENSAIAGFSLGALSAFDLAWHYPAVFGVAGLFSGSFWWRSKDLDKGYQPQDRIALQCINERRQKETIRFWFQTGWLDESVDRDSDGLIDSIGDTLDVILGLQHVGYQLGTDIDYVELGSGHHDHKTMAKVFPLFLNWFAGQN